MVRGTIRLNKDRPKPYECLVDLGTDQATGKRRQRSKSFRTKREAQTFLTQWQASVDNGTAVDRSTQTVSEMMAYWLETSRPNLRASTYEIYQRIVEGHITPTIGTVQAQKLTADRLEKLYADMIAAGRRPRARRALRAPDGEHRGRRADDRPAQDDERAQGRGATA